MRIQIILSVMTALLMLVGCDRGSSRVGAPAPSAPSSNQLPQGNVGGEGRGPEAVVPKGNNTSPNPTSGVP